MGERPATNPVGRQLALPFAHRPRFERADFLRAPSNAAALAWLDPASATGWPQNRLALWGEAGSGKTHLLHVWAAEHEALLLPGTALRGFALPSRPGRPKRWRAIAVDDADEATDEAALLHLLNAAAEAGLPVLLTARAAPSRWSTGLADLASRLRAIHSVPIGQPDEAMLRILLLRLLVERQLVVAPSVVDWLLARLPRTAGAMRDAARALDEAALASGRRVTRALAAAVLDDPPRWFAEEPEELGAARLI
ncbi:chromosomal replication initiator DnaA [Acetobacteraceae bacterium KSS8]|uniref:Chromosomal replication initiator DnaA n=1 Tax=Endosaccharibacter trunci TaxID=2812733 RepID=A0ABT1W2N9_9PROT|nr:chromosomal replication initiator DnaA [Acetobacteraceae bacterium KSS8]